MRKVFGLLLGTLFVMCMGNACDDVKDATENLCGPCGEVSAGDDFISGDARLDGFFKAVGSFGSATDVIDGSFKADMMALGELFGVADMEGMSITELTAAVKAAIEAEIDANIEPQSDGYLASQIVAEEPGLHLVVVRQAKGPDGTPIESSADLSVGIGDIIPIIID